ncbi:CYTH domain-containing protein [archaeon]|jgi:predicted adenylyl cyclase CyaB|nr:CYTH domain-containing protein [archaeon]MBT3730535.1 CYTH domain-containing protein [archaeon]MBT4669399.1 CYTH domain-containing protein [archaeon]MBT5029848.1 CYTH domain-containing protein [archaeon]MBT5288061.1 CYTH domain-containing protein [archaeon]
MNIEVEIRSFISKEQYENLINYFTKNAELINKDYQETFYFDSDEDLRIQKNDFFSKIWLKKGKLHDDHREEIEIKSKKEDFEVFEKLFLSLGYNVDIKWFRNRHTFKWEDILVMLDYTKGYGYIIEFEKMSTEENKETTLNLLKEKFQTLNLPISPKEDFNKKYIHYKENWKTLTL